MIITTLHLFIGFLVASSSILSNISIKQFSLNHFKFYHGKSQYREHIQQI